MVVDHISEKHAEYFCDVGDFLIYFRRKINGQIQDNNHHQGALLHLVNGQTTSPTLVWLDSTVEIAELYFFTEIWFIAALL